MLTLHFDSSIFDTFDTLKRECYERVICLEPADNLKEDCHFLGTKRFSQEELYLNTVVQSVFQYTTPVTWNHSPKLLVDVIIWLQKRVQHYFFCKIFAHFKIEIAISGQNDIIPHQINRFRKSRKEICSVGSRFQIKKWSFPPDLAVKGRCYRIL